jgi:hypothetical protein
VVTSTHETLHRFFRDHPEAIDRTFRAVGLKNVPETAAARVLPNDVTEIKPLERRVDTAMLIKTRGGGSYVLVFEAQSNIDESKQRSWPYYVSYLHERYKCPVVLVVICQNRTTAEWAREPIRMETDFWTSLVVYPLVLSPENVPVLEDVAETDLLLATLSVITHGREADGGGMLKLAKALRRVDDQTHADLATYVLLGLGSLPAADIWRTMMLMDLELLRTSPIIRGWLDDHDRQVEAEARTEARVESILRILGKRSIELTGEQRERIGSCTDPAQLDAWFDAALDATCADELFR